MAQFEIAHKRTALNEGLYANNPSDTGGETWAGISRKNWPKWDGWAIIDAIKRDHGKTTTIINKFGGSNQILAGKVSEFYKTNFWYPLSLQYVNDQQLANNVYDFGVNAGVSAAAKRLQRAANSVCGNIEVDGDIGSATLGLVNKLNAKSVYDAFNNLRAEFYNNIIAKNPSQAQFRKSWFSRIVPYKVA